ncbi:MarR family winged helix-turn-helix transcriptional regulator [Cellulomonas citrea]|uniref:MarR family winged helix-turn-helix transcriptional regulator n=1 Tax=Cellulomonas citrea TaxID=1909423 RepID=UPI003F69BFE9
MTSSTLAQDLRRALSMASRRVKAERGDAGLPDPQFNVLAMLHAHGAMTPGQLAEAERIQPPSMTRTVNCLVELGLVAKTEHPTDGRQVLVDLTEAGRAEVHETRRRRDAWLTGRLSQLTADERARLGEAVELLRRIAAS